jgi:hypothetical protein
MNMPEIMERNRELMQESMLTRERERPLTKTGTLKNVSNGKLPE